MPDIEKVIKALETCRDQNNPPGYRFTSCVDDCPYHGNGCARKLKEDALELLKEQDEVVHPEPSCEMTYITDCCCDLCGVQLIREDNFCRCCGKRIEWESR